MSASISLHIDTRMAAYGFQRGSAPGGRHYLGADRFAAFYKEFLARGLDLKTDIVGASPRATFRELTLFHEADYIDHVRQTCRAGTGLLGQNAVRAERGMDLIAAAVTGTALHAAKRVVSGETQRAFVPIAGFPFAARNGAIRTSIYNDVAILITYLKLALPAPRIAYIDLDAYFCGTVYEHFKEDPLVAVLDIHQDAASFWAPEDMGTDYGAETTPNAWSHVMPEGAGDAAFMEVWPRMVAWINEFRPDLIIVNAGTTGLRDDGVGGLTYTPALFRRAVQDLVRKAEQLSQGRMIVLGGSGHSLRNLANLWCDVVEDLFNSADAEKPDAQSETSAASADALPLPEGANAPEEAAPTPS